MPTATHLSALAFAAVLVAAAGPAAGQRLDGQVLRDDVEVRVSVLFEYGLTVLTCQEGAGSGGDCVGFRLSGVDAGHRLRGQVCRKAARSKALECGPQVGPSGAAFAVGSNLTLRTSLYQPPSYLPDPRRRRRWAEAPEAAGEEGVYFTVSAAGAEGGHHDGQLRVRLPEAVNKWGNLWVTTDLGPVQYVPSAREMGEPLVAGQSARVHYSTLVSSALGGDYSSRLRIALCAGAGPEPGRCRVLQLVGSAAKGAYLREAYDAPAITSPDWTTVRARDTSRWPFAAGGRHTFIVQRRSEEQLAVWSEANPADVYLVPLDANLVHLWVYSYSAVTFLYPEAPATTTTTPASTTTAGHSTPWGTKSSDETPGWGTSHGHLTHDWGDKAPYWEPARGDPKSHWGNKGSDWDPARGDHAYDWGSKPYWDPAREEDHTYDRGSKKSDWGPAREDPKPDWGEKASYWEPAREDPTSEWGSEAARTSTWPPQPTPVRCQPSFENLRIPAGGDCGSYVVCYSGRSQLMPCGPGTLFNYRLQTCDWPQNVQCPASRRDGPWSSFGGYY